MKIHFGMAQYPEFGAAAFGNGIPCRLLRTEYPNAKVLAEKTQPDSAED